jgi:hypothetical protein
VRFVTVAFAFMLLASLGVATAQAKDGSVVAWGYNGQGQCDVPSRNTGFVAVAAGAVHNLGLKSDGSIVAWGANHQAIYGSGQCDVSSPNAGFVAIGAGCMHSLGLKSDGSIVAWGNNSAGQCDVPSPNTDFVGVAAGCSHSLGLKSDGSVVAWGDNGSGECIVPGPNAGFIAIDAGEYFSIGLRSDGSIELWGKDNVDQTFLPGPNAGFVAIAAGSFFSLGLKSNGSVVAWGGNWDGECNVPSPNTGFVAVSAGANHSLGLKSDGSIVAWGQNEHGQCNVPAPNTGFVAIAAGGECSLGLLGSPQVPTEVPAAIFRFGKDSSGGDILVVSHANLTQTAKSAQGSALEAQVFAEATFAVKYGACMVGGTRCDLTLTPKSFSTSAPSGGEPLTLASDSQYCILLKGAGATSPVCPPLIELRNRDSAPESGWTFRAIPIPFVGGSTEEPGLLGKTCAVNSENLTGSQILACSVGNVIDAYLEARGASQDSRDESWREAARNYEPVRYYVRK